MDKATIAKPCRLGDRERNDIIISLKDKEGQQELFYFHSSILADNSEYFANHLADPNSDSLIEIQCSDRNYDHHVKLLSLLYLPAQSILESLNSVESAIGILELAVAFRCEEIVQCCVRYLEAVPWEGEEEEQVLKVVGKVGRVAMPILARIQPVDTTATKNVFVSAVRFAVSVNGPCPPFGAELKTSAQEQVEFMLGEDEDLPLVIVDDEVKSVVRTGLSKLCKSFEHGLSSLLLEPSLESDTAEAEILRSLSDLEWMCNILPKMDLMKDFVSSWAEISVTVLMIVGHQKFDSLMWGLKAKVVEVTAKVLDAVGYGNVILPAPCRVTLLKTWLPFVRKIKPRLDLKGNEDINFPRKLDDDLWQGIEGAIVSMILSLPSNDQADILGDWMTADQVRYPDLSEAFEAWCFRTKSAKRRLMEGVNKVGNATITL